MPILPAEPDLYPPDLWERGPLPAQGAPGPRWMCLHAKPRQEKATARHLHARRLTYYLPQVVREGRTPKGRKIRSTVPLFPGYLFLHGDDRDRIEALKGDTLNQVLEVPDQAAIGRDLHQIHRMLSSGLPVVPEPTHPPGSRVRIAVGPLAGLVGVVVRRDQRDHFVAIIHFLGSGAAVELQDWQVEAVGAPGPGDAPS